MMSIDERERLNKASMYDRGDVLETRDGNRYCVIEILASVSYGCIVYRLKRKEDGGCEMLPEEALATLGADKLSEMDRPYGWGE